MLAFQEDRGEPGFAVPCCPRSSQLTNVFNPPQAAKFVILCLCVCAEAVLCWYPYCSGELEQKSSSPSVAAGEAAPLLMARGLQGGS